MVTRVGNRLVIWDLKDVLLSTKDQPANRSAHGLILNSKERLNYLSENKKNKKFKWGTTAKEEIVLGNSKRRINEKY